MFVIHILACGIFAIGKANLRNGTQNWIRGYLNAEFEDWLNQYIYAYVTAHAPGPSPLKSCHPANAASNAASDATSNLR